MNNNTITIDADLSENLKKIANYNDNSPREQIIDFLLLKYPELSDYNEDLDEVKVFSKRGNYILSLPDKVYQVIQSISDKEGVEIYNMVNDDIEDYVNNNSDILDNYNEDDYPVDENYDEDYDYDDEDYYDDYDEEDYYDDDYDEEDRY